MSDGWGNPVIGGADKLIRRAMQSPDYVAGVDGWTVNKDGTAEFNDVTIRGSVVVATTSSAGGSILVYDGPPAAGNLIFAVSDAEGIDVYGNGYAVGLTLPAETASSQSGTLRWKQAGGLSGLLTIGEILAFTDAGDPRVEIWARNAARLLFQYDDTSAGLQFGAGPTGRYYAESEFFTAFVVNSGGALKTINAVEAITVHGNDYLSPAGFDLGATGTWKCPESGLYSASLVLPFQAWVAGSVIRLAVTDTNTGQFTSTDYESLTGRGVLTTDIDCIKDHVFVAQVFQNTGVAQTLFNSLGATAQAARWTMRRYL